MNKCLFNQRFQQRLQRFGTVAPEAKKISRALRFGTVHVRHSDRISIHSRYSFNLFKEAIDGTAKKRRLERFGVIPHSAVSFCRWSS